MPIRVFISHSTHQSQDKLFFEDLCKRLEASTEAGETIFDVFIDTNIKAGESWRNKLLRYIGKCQAGVVLLNKEAITTSEWVHTEATLLRWRQWLDADVVLIMILLGRGTQQLLQKTPKWWPLSFREVQFLSDIQGQLEFTGTSMNADVFDILVDRLKEARKIETSFDKLRASIRTQLNRAFIGSGIDAEEIEQLVEGILTEGPQHINVLIKNFSGYFDRLPTSIESALELIAPWWVNPMASCPLARPNIHSKENTAFCLNSSNPQYYGYTSKMYIRHAVCLAPQFSEKRMVFVLGRSGYQDSQKHIEDVLSEVRSGLKQRIGASRVSDIERVVPPEQVDAVIDNEINRWLKRQTDQRRSIFVVLPPHVAVITDLIDMIYRNYPLVTLLLLMNSGETVLKINHAKYLEPFLDPIIEQNAYDCYMDIKANFDESF